MNEDKLFKTIMFEVLSIEKDLDDLGKGIFFAPELYIGFRISKSIYNNRATIFPKYKEVEWQRELDLHNGGPSDIVFNLGNEQLIIELKMRNTYDSYEKDITKLMRLQNNGGIKQHKYFCALVDAFKDKEDGRLQKLITEQNLKDNRHISFETKKYSYQSDIYCHLILLKIN